MENGRIAMTVRYLLGVTMAFFGINGFFQFVTPPALSVPAMDFLSAIVNTGYLFEFTNIIFIIVAILLLSNKYVPLALALLFPIMLNVVLFHIFLDVSSGVAGYLVFIMNIYLIAVYEDSFRPLLRK